MLRVNQVQMIYDSPMIRGSCSIVPTRNEGYKIAGKNDEMYPLFKFVILLSGFSKIAHIRSWSSRAYSHAAVPC